MTYLAFLAAVHFAVTVDVLVVPPTVVVVVFAAVTVTVFVTLDVTVKVAVIVTIEAGPARNSQRQRMLR